MYIYLEKQKRPIIINMKTSRIINFNEISFNRQLSYMRNLKKQFKIFEISDYFQLFLTKIEVTETYFSLSHYN